MISFMYDLVSFNGAPFEDYSTAKVQNPINIYKWFLHQFSPLSARKKHADQRKQLVGINLVEAVLGKTLWVHRG